jgi:hypothetical protein
MSLSSPEEVKSSPEEDKSSPEEENNSLEEVKAKRNPHRKK